MITKNSDEDIFTITLLKTLNDLYDKINNLKETIKGLHKNDKRSILHYSTIMECEDRIKKIVDDIGIDNLLDITKKANDITLLSNLEHFKQ